MGRENDRVTENVGAVSARPRQKNNTKRANKGRQTQPLQAQRKTKENNK
jgi:hypothetical protein